jgi:hypothetical protein
MEERDNRFGYVAPCAPSVRAIAFTIPVGIMDSDSIRESFRLEAEKEIARLRTKLADDRGLILLEMDRLRELLESAHTEASKVRSDMDLLA